MTTGASRRRAALPLGLLCAAFLGGAVHAREGADDVDDRLAALRRSEQSARPPSAQSATRELAEIGRLYLESGRLGPAIEVLDETVARNPDDALSLARLVLAYARREDFDFASSYLEVAAQHEPARSDSVLYAEIGNRLAAVNRLDAAVMAWELYRRGGGSDRSVLSMLDRAKRELSATPGQRSLANDHFSIFADEAVPTSDLRRVESALSDEYDRQASLFGAPLEKPQVVVLYGGRRYFSLVSIPDWVSGVFDGKIRVSLDVSRPSGPEVEAVLSHELAHAFIREISGGRAPGWLHEGLAQWCSGRRIPRADFRRELGSGHPRSLGDMEGNLAIPFDPDSARANYAEALGIVEYLVATRGEGSIFCLVRDLGAGEELAPAIRRESGMTSAQLVSAWKSWAGL